MVVAGLPKPQPQLQWNLSSGLEVFAAESTAAGEIFEWVTEKYYMRQ